MATKIPETGSAALTYDKVADVGVFDGRIVVARSTPKGGGPPVAAGSVGSGAATKTARATPPATRSARKGTSQGGRAPRPATKASAGVSPAKRSPRTASPEAGPAEASPEARPKRYRLLLVAGIVLVITGAIGVGYGVLSVVISDRVAAHAQADLRPQFEERQALAAAGQLGEAFDPSLAASEAQPGPSPEDFANADDVPVIFGDAGDAPAIALPDTPAWHTELAPSPGNPVGRISIPSAGIDWIIVEGVDPDDLAKGPGHMPGTPLPGQAGNAVISGHRTTHGAPFGKLDALDPGTRFTVETLIGIHTYQVVSVEIVNPTDTWVVQPMEGGWLTLITCNPKYSSRQRLIVFSKLVAGPNIEALNAAYDVTYAPPEPPGEGSVPVEH